MRLDEAVKYFLDGKKVERETGWICSFESRSPDLVLVSSNGDFADRWPIDGWRLKRETLTPAQAWERMKAGKVIASENHNTRFRVLGAGSLQCSIQGGPWEAVQSVFDRLMEHNLYEVDENDNR